MNFREKITQSIIDHPNRAIMISILMVLVSIPGLFQIKSDFSYRIWYSEQDPLLQRYDFYEKLFGNDDSLVLGIYREEGLYNEESLVHLEELTNDIWKVDSVIRVDSLTNFDYVDIVEDEIDVGALVDTQSIDQSYIEKLKKKVKDHSFIEENYISKDGKLSVIVAKIKPSFNSIADNELITKQIRALVEKKGMENYKYQIIGTAILTHIFKEITQEDVGRLVPILFVIFTLILWMIYKNISGVLIPYVILITSIIMMMGLSGYLGIKVNTLSAVAPNILLTVAIADSIHLLTVFFIAKSHGNSVQSSVRHALIKNVYPTLLTSLTTCVGFLSFSNAKIDPISGMGVMVGFGVIFAWLLTYGLIAPLLLKFVKDEHSGEIENDVKVIISEKSKKSIAFINNYRWPILILTILSIGFSIHMAVKNLKVNLDPYSQFPSDYKFIQDINKIEKHNGPSDSIVFLIDAGGINQAKSSEFLVKVDSFQQWLESKPYIHSTFGITDIIKDINKTLNQNNKSFETIPDDRETIAQELVFYSMGLPPGKELNDKISLKNDYINLSAKWTIRNSQEALGLFRTMEKKAKEIGLDAKVTGKTPLFHELTPYVVSSFVESFVLAFVLITLILIITLKSLKLGLLALIPNLYPLIIGSLFFVFFGWDIDMGSVIIASVCLGIAVDDSIHFLFSYKKLKDKGESTLSTLENVFETTIPSLVNTTLIIVAGFGVFYFAQYVPNSNFGVMVALILTVALLADVIILPAVLLILDRDKK